MRLKFFTIGSLFFAFFVLFSFIVHKDFFTQFDFNTTVRLQDKIPRKFDDAFSFLSELGKFEPMTILLLTIIVFLIFRKKFLGIFTILFFGLLHVFELYGKFFVSHLPPPQFMLRVKHLIDFPQFHVRLENSYPSGHAGRAAFLTVILGIIVWKSKRISHTQKLIIIGVLAIYDGLMFVSRIYLGEHWATDVIGGAILGASLGLLSFVFI